MIAVFVIAYETLHTVWPVSSLVKPAM